MSYTTSVAQDLSRELAESQRNCLALTAAGQNSGGSKALVTQGSKGPLATLLEKVEAHIQTCELSLLISERQYQEAFTLALERCDVSIAPWLCSQVNLREILAIDPLPLSQEVLVSLLQQLAFDLGKNTSLKLPWITDVVTAINPSNKIIVDQGWPIFEQVSQILHYHLNLRGNDDTVIRLILHAINSMLKGCK